MLSRVSTIAKIMTVGSVLSSCVLACLLSMNGIDGFESYEEISKRDLTVIGYLVYSTIRGFGYFVIGFIPSLMGLGFLVFYMRQIFVVSKRAEALWSASGLFNLCGMALVVIFFTNPLVLSRAVNIIFLVWIVTAIGLSSYARHLISLERMRKQQAIKTNS